MRHLQLGIHSHRPDFLDGCVKRCWRTFGEGNCHRPRFAFDDGSGRFTGAEVLPMKGSGKNKTSLCSTQSFIARHLNFLSTSHCQQLFTNCA